MKICIEPGCWTPTPDTRCPDHQRARNRTTEAKYRARRHRDLVIPPGAVCACCGSDADLCRDHNPDGYRVLCRPCNGSKGGKVMRDQRCPMHGGQVA